MLCKVKKTMLVVSMVAALLCGATVYAGAESDAVTEDTAVTDVVEEETTGAETAEVEEEDGGLDVGYLVKGGIILGIGIVLYVIVSVRSKNS